MGVGAGRIDLDRLSRFIDHHPNRRELGRVTSSTLSPRTVQQFHFSICKAISMQVEPSSPEERTLGLNLWT
jgi:hypothetical protein